MPKDTLAQFFFRAFNIPPILRYVSNKQKYAKKMVPTFQFKRRGYITNGVYYSFRFKEMIDRYQSFDNAKSELLIVYDNDEYCETIEETDLSELMIHKKNVFCEYSLLRNDSTIAYKNIQPQLIDLLNRFEFYETLRRDVDTFGYLAKTDRKVYQYLITHFRVLCFHLAEFPHQNIAQIGYLGERIFFTHYAYKYSEIKRIRDDIIREIVYYQKTANIQDILIQKYLDLFHRLLYILIDNEPINNE
jgi:hypothetical protein